MATHNRARRRGPAAASAVRLVVSARVLAVCSSNPLIPLACGLAGRRRLGDLVETCALIPSLEEHPLGRIEDPRFHVARQVFGRSSRTRSFQIVVLAHHRLHLIATPPPCLGAGMLPPISRLAIAWTVALIQINFYV